MSTYDNSLVIESLLLSMVPVMDGLETRAYGNCLDIKCGEMTSVFRVRCLRYDSIYGIFTEFIKGYKELARVSVKYGEDSWQYRDLCKELQHLEHESFCVMNDTSAVREYL